MAWKNGGEKWQKLLTQLITNGQSVAIGIFSINGHLKQANTAMDFFLDTDKINRDPRNSFVNPNFETLAKINHDDQIFEGLLTIGNYSDISYSLDAKIFKQDSEILVFAEVNVPLLFEQNQQMSRLNQEVNNLQRQLMKEKKSLQSTLAELKSTQEMLIHSEKMNALGKLVAGVAHEINNPISFIYSNAFSLEKYTNEMIQSLLEIEKAVRQKGDKELNEFVLEIHNKNEIDYLKEDIPDLIKESKVGIERVKTIVEDLRRFSRLDESAIKRIDLIENINTTLTIAHAEIAKKNIKLSLSAPNSLFINCYPGQLNQALLNMIINATQAINDTGNIWISVTEDQNQVILSIKDDGCGIPDSIAKKIFDPFFTTKEVGQGTGLGLSITYKIIHELHNGEIKVISPSDKGVEFIVTIPKITH
jgi:signal transduction histidine kinase